MKKLFIHHIMLPKIIHLQWISRSRFAATTARIIDCIFTGTLVLLLRLLRLLLLRRAASTLLLVRLVTGASKVAGLATIEAFANTDGGGHHIHAKLLALRRPLRRR